MLEKSVFFFLQIYAVTNTLVLYVGCGVDWFSHITETTYIANFSDWLCRVWQFIYNVIIYAAGWIVVSMSIDRFIIVWHPRQAPYMCTVFMAKLVTIIILIGLVVVSIHAMWTYELTSHGCNIDPMQQDFPDHSLAVDISHSVLLHTARAHIYLPDHAPNWASLSEVRSRFCDKHEPNYTRSADKIRSCRFFRLLGFKFTDHNSELHGVRKFKCPIPRLSLDGQTVTGTNSMPDNLMLKLCPVLCIVFCNGATDEERTNDPAEKTERIKYLIHRRNAEHGSEHEWRHVCN